MNRKWKQLWANIITTVLISLFCTAVGLGALYSMRSSFPAV